MFFFYCSPLYVAMIMFLLIISIRLYGMPVDVFCALPTTFMDSSPRSIRMVFADGLEWTQGNYPSPNSGSEECEGLPAVVGVIVAGLQQKAVTKRKGI